MPRKETLQFKCFFEVFGFFNNVTTILYSEYYHRTSRHPQVGIAPAPNLSGAKSKISSKRDKKDKDSGRRSKKKDDKPSSRVKIFDDQAYLKAVKVRFSNKISSIQG